MLCIAALDLSHPRTKLGHRPVFNSNNNKTTRKLQLLFLFGHHPGSLSSFNNNNNNNKATRKIKSNRWSISQVRPPFHYRLQHSATTSPFAMLCHHPALFSCVPVLQLLILQVMSPLPSRVTALCSSQAIFVNPVALLPVEGTSASKRSSDNDPQRSSDNETFLSFKLPQPVNRPSLLRLGSFTILRLRCFLHFYKFFFLC